jgi:hypothetical protein
MNEIETEMDIDLVASKEQAKACQRLWSMVILYALRDARERIANTKAKNLEWRCVRRWIISQVEILKRYADLLVLKLS